MSDNTAGYGLPEVDLEQLTAEQQLRLVQDSQVLSLVKKSFDHAEQYRSKNHDNRWRESDALYFGQVPQKYWEGTTVPRSSLPWPIAFDQVEAAYPIVTNALFGSSGDWFQVEPLPGTTLEEARAQHAALRYVLENPVDDFAGNAVNEISLAIQSGLQYGNSGICIEYDPLAQQPVVEWLDLRELYIDPAVSTPSIDQARYAIRRKLMTVESLLALKGSPGMRIPSKYELLRMANSRPLTYGDQTVQVSAAMHGESYNPGADDFLPLPTDRFVEVFIYYNKKNIYWVLNKEWVALNMRNKLGFIPYCVAPCYTVLGRLYARSIPEIQKHNQRAIEGITNARLDELSLAINPPRYRARGTTITPSQMRLRPGQVTDVGDPQKDIMTQQPSNITQHAFAEAQMLESRAQKVSGINDFAVQGSLMKSSASKTAAGVQAQASAPLSRLQKIVANIENYLIVPMLYKVTKMMEVYSQEGQMLPGYTEKKDLVYINSGVMKKKTRFRILAASKMLTREKLAAMFPFVVQYLFSGPFMSELAKTGRTINFDDVFKLFQDATGTDGLYNFIRQLTPEEQQKMQAPPPQVQAQMMMQQQEGLVRKEIMQMKSQTELQKAMMGSETKKEVQGETSAIALMKLLQAAMNERKQRQQQANNPTLGK
jgi:hypothetical protein